MCNSLSLKHNVNCPLRTYFQGKQIQNLPAGIAPGEPSVPQCGHSPQGHPRAQGTEGRDSQGRDFGHCQVVSGGAG